MKLRKKQYRWISFIMLVIMCTPWGTNSYGAIDEDQGILSAPIGNTYNGRAIVEEMLPNINFTDVSSSYWGREAIMRLSALDIVKGYNVNGRYEFRPEANVSKEEALAFILRSIGLEEQAKIAAETIITIPPDSTVTTWSKGYLTVANQFGLITAPQLADSLVQDQTLLDPTLNFIRTAAVTREQLAKWVVDGINSQNPGAIAPLYRQQSIFNYDDWQDIGLEYIPYIEAVTEAKIMVGDGKSFNPKDYLSRAELIQTIKNLDSILYNTMKLTVKSGYVGHVDKTFSSGGQGNQTDYVALVRVSDGSVDKFVGNLSSDMLNRSFMKDAVVYKNKAVMTISGLEEGDTIHYIVNNQTKEIYYVEVQPANATYHLTGILQPFIELDKGKITIINQQGNTQTLTMASSIYDSTNKMILINDYFVAIKDMPITNNVSLSIKNQLVTGIEFAGNLVIATELSGLVIEHNTDFNYIRISDWNGNEVIKKYNEGSVTVEKEAYYDSEDQVGYFDELFPYYGFDEDDGSISDIEAGDIVHVRLNPSNLEYIQAISAKTNYTVKFGEVITAIYSGDQGVKLTLLMSDNTVVSYLISDKVPVIKGTKNVSMIDIASGDMVRLLVNQAVIAPGTMKEEIKEISIDPNGNIIEMVYKGEFSTFNTSQETITLRNSYELTQTGWKNYSTAITLDISSETIDYYYNNKPITLAYADKYLRQEGMDVYVATEKYFSNEKVNKVTFREGRDSVLPYSNVTISNGLNQVQTQNHEGVIAIDEGTIVVKNDKMISPSNIMAPDYTQVVLNGNNQAAVVIIKPEPNNDGISIFRGRVAKINDLEDFTVQSHAMLSDMEWIYSPIERTFEIDYKTVIKDEENVMGIDEFIGYSDISKVDEVYTIIAQGVSATHIIKNPYCTQGVIGEIYSFDENEIALKDTLVYNGDTKEWNELSFSNSYSLIEILNETVIIKNNEVIALEQLEFGDRIKIMTTVDLAELLKLEGERNVPGYIILVE